MSDKFPAQQIENFAYILPNNLKLSRKDQIIALPAS